MNNHSAHFARLNIRITAPKSSLPRSMGLKSSLAKSNAHWWSVMSPLCTKKSHSCVLKYSTARSATFSVFLYLRICVPVMFLRSSPSQYCMSASKPNRKCGSRDPVGTDFESASARDDSAGIARRRACDAGLEIDVVKS